MFVQITSFKMAETRKRTNICLYRLHHLNMAETRKRTTICSYRLHHLRWPKRVRGLSYVCTDYIIYDGRNA